MHLLIFLQNINASVKNLFSVIREIIFFKHDYIKMHLRGYTTVERQKQRFF